RHRSVTPADPDPGVAIELPSRRDPAGEDYERVSDEDHRYQAKQERQRRCAGDDPCHDRRQQVDPPSGGLPANRDPDGAEEPYTVFLQLVLLGDQGGRWPVRSRLPRLPWPLWRG